MAVINVMVLFDRKFCAMSGHSFGAGNEPPRQQKAETIRLGMISDVRAPEILKVK